MMRWAGDVGLKGEVKNTCRVFFVKPEGSEATWKTYVLI
jgi:hypothetical protein